MMFGYASNETPEYLPMPIALAHRLARRLAEVRKSGELSYLRPDGKTQVTVEYEDGKPVRVDTIVISTQHDPDVTQAEIHDDMVKHVIEPTIPAKFLQDTKYFINPTGRFVIGGPQGDAGLTGRKIIVDTYGGMARHGGGAFSGKDPTKVDRSAAYAARYVAKNIVAAASLTVARSSSPMPSASHVRSPSSSIPSVPARSPMKPSSHSFVNISNCVRPALSTCSTSAARSTSRPRPMVTSAAPMWTSRGNILIKRKC